MAIHLKEISEMFGFDEMTANVYVELLSLRQLSKAEMKLFLDIDNEELDRSLTTLENHNLISFDETQAIFAPLPLDTYGSEDSETVENIKRVMFQIKDSEDIGIVKYEGWDGIRKVYLEVLEEAIRTGEDIYAFEHNLNNAIIGDGFTESYIRRRVENNVRALVICPINEEDKQYKDCYQSECTTVKLVDSFELDANINVVGDLVMSFCSDPAEGTLRRNRAEATTLKAIFKKIWNS